MSMQCDNLTKYGGKIGELDCQQLLVSHYGGQNASMLVVLHSFYSVQSFERAAQTSANAVIRYLDIQHVAGYQRGQIYRD